MQRIEAERAARRMISGKKVNPGSNLAQGRTDEHVAAELGISTGQWKKLKTIFERAQQGDAEAVHSTHTGPAGSPQNERYAARG